MKTTDLPVMRATTQDFEAITELLQAAALPVAQSAEKVCFLVARNNGTICGCIGWERYDNVVLLRSLAVAPDQRNAGIASHLVKTAIAELKLQGACEFYLLTEHAAAFAERFGFQCCDRCSLPQQLQASAQVNTGCCSSAQAMRLFIV
ncbi:MAG TPA: GNAT family N-acetyltransferase [Candidatus Obscuribacterales bacterium]